jgi:predicted DNA-binding transcriptional regulator AlpA
MPTQIDGVPYFSAAELVDELGISRQTLWRWRQEGHVPMGYRFRDRQILFTADEAEVIRRYAFRLQPADTSAPRQLSLFERRG